jgi:site-specific DNA-methyltransferase (cytosine-N4-specific)
MQKSLFPLSFYHTSTGTAPVRSALQARYAGLMRDAPGLARLVSYVRNRKVPGLRLYRYKEAFSAALVQYFLQLWETDLTAESVIFDPFSGMGTTALTAMGAGLEGWGLDRLPVAITVSTALAYLPQLKPGELIETFRRLKSQVPLLPLAPIAEDVRIMGLAFPPETLERLRRWKTAIDHLEDPLQTVFLLLFFAILEPCSYTAKDGQFLRLKPQKTVAFPDDALAAKVHEAEEDVAYFNQHPVKGQAHFLTGDARALGKVPLPRPPSLVITSPPYANRYDYTRTYALELCFHFVKNFDEMRALRHDILRSHIEARLGKDEVSPHPAVSEVESALKKKSLNNPRIPTMLTAYFIDMQRVIQGLEDIIQPGGRVVMVVDNVRFEGEMVPVDLILSDMATEAGFIVQEILVARYKGNSSQQMKKYGRVPVRESVLIWQKPQTIPPDVAGS